MANLVNGVDFCKRVNEFMGEDIGCHVALTGGCLYEEGERKDIDIIIFPRQDTAINQGKLFQVWLHMGCMPIQFFGRVTKMKWKGFHIDVIQPEYKGEYLKIK